MKKYSIVICTYNGERTIGAVLQQILKMKCLSSLVETIIVVDNASTDQTKMIVRRFEECNHLVKYEYEGVPGLSNARKHATFCETEWVVFLDDDNFPCVDWIKKMDSNIGKRTSIGVANSACVAVPQGEFTDEEKMKLDIIASNIACTHSSLNDYFLEKKAKMNRPFGAGMFVKTSALKSYNESGWTTNVGRTKNNLGSGEDGEIASAIIAQGFTFELFLNTYIEHWIPKSRVQDCYIDKLYKGLIDGFAIYLGTKKHPLFRKILSFSKSILLIPFLFISKYFSFSKKKRIKAEIDFKARKYLASIVFRHKNG